MSCPYLKEASVRHCHGSALRKLIATEPGSVADERCSTASFRDCSIFRQYPAPPSEVGRCPYLQDSLAHFCGAAPVRRFVPFTQQAGRCGGEGYRYCELYLAIARPVAPAQSPTVPHVRGIPVPSDLYYSPNHLWAHPGPNGSCHVGIDAFFAFVIGAACQLSFVTTTGVHRPSAVISVRGVDWPVSFPHPLLLNGANVYLRRDPVRLTADPYGAGWLFEGWELPSGPRVSNQLIPGTQALAWFEQEFDRLDRFVHALSPAPNDGGSAAQNLIEHLDRDSVLRLFHEFFAPHQSWRDSN